MGELSSDQFNLWRRHPVTELVLDRYLADFAGTVERGVLESWLRGALSLQVEQDARGYIHAIRHLQALRLDGVRQFYNAPMPEEERRAMRDFTRRDSGTGYA